MRFVPGDAHRELQPEWLAIDPVLRAHWRTLICHCGALETSGWLRGARAWSESTWRGLFRVSKKTLRSMAKRGLVEWHGDDLKIAHYDVFAEQTARERSEDRKRAALAAWARRRAKEGQETPSTDRSGESTSMPGVIGRPNDSNHLVDGAASRQGMPRTHARTKIRSGSSPPPPPGGVSASPAEGTKGGGGARLRRLADPDWQSIKAVLPSWRPYWEEGARQAFDLLELEDVTPCVEWIQAQAKTASWRASPPTPRAIAQAFDDHRRRKAAPAKRRRDDVKIEPKKAPEERGWS